MPSCLVSRISPINPYISPESPELPKTFRQFIQQMAVGTCCWFALRRLVSRWLPKGVVKVPKSNRTRFLFAFEKKKDTVDGNVEDKDEHGMIYKNFSICC